MMQQRARKMQRLSREEYENKLKDIDKEAEKILSDARKRALENEN